MNLRLFSILLLLFLIGLSGLALGQQARTLNSTSPGERFEVESYLKKGQLNIIFLSSPLSQPAQELEAALVKLTEKNKGIALGKLLVDRTSSEKVDWTSPLARQFNLRWLPLVFVYDGEKKLIAQGYDARKLVVKMMSEQ